MRIAALALGVLALVATNSFAAPDAAAFKVAYVDLQKALQSTEAGKKAKSQLEKDVAAKRTQIEKTQAQLQSDAEQFEKKAALLSETAKAQKQQELQKRFVEFQKTATESQMELQKKERELTKPIIDELRAVIEGIGKEKGFQLILEKNEGAVLYAQEGSDLTESVIEKFNARVKSKKK